MQRSLLEYRFFIVLLVVVSLAFGWILIPFYGAVFWAVVLCILFMPVQRRLLRACGERRNLATLGTTLICLLIAVIPVFITGTLLVREGATLFQRMESGELDLNAQMDTFREALPVSVQLQLQRLGLDDWTGLRERLSSAAMEGSQFIATRAFSIGQNTLSFVVSFFVMLYLLFFLLRDGSALLAKVRQAIPLAENKKRRLFNKFARVVRATVKGNLVVALVQGALGGIIFAVLGIPSAMLWGVMMVLLSLLPAVGAGLVWGPVALYFLFSGAVAKGVILIAFGVLVIGLVDNVLRPILVGRDTKMPDYLVLISTLGGLVLFGLNGFVIGPLIAALFVSIWSIFTEQTPQPRPSSGAIILPDGARAPSEEA
jgi:predicted PurR-regulated permease PerM